MLLATPSRHSQTLAASNVLLARSTIFPALHLLPDQRIEDGFGGRVDRLVNLSISNCLNGPPYGKKFQLPAGTFAICIGLALAQVHQDREETKSDMNESEPGVSFGPTAVIAPFRMDAQLR